MTAFKKTGLFILIAILMGAAIYLTFEKFFAEGIPNYAVNISAAFLGAVITIIITAVLLNAQSLSELGKEKSVGVFNAKLALYSEFLDFINKITRDGLIDENEIVDLRGWALKLSLVSSSAATNTVCNFIDQSARFRYLSWEQMSQSQQGEWTTWYSALVGEEPEIGESGNLSFLTVGRVIMELKIDLGEEHISGFDDAAENSFVIDEMMARI